MGEWPNDWHALGGLVTLPEEMRRLGYRTGLFGKYHLGESATPGAGWDDWVTMEHGHVRSFYSNRIASTAVSNVQLRDFIAATGYVTTAERQGLSLVFAGQLDDPERHAIADAATPWWRVVPGVCWRRPALKEVDADLPVVHVSLEDSHAYCSWSGTHLSTEAEWEFAASLHDQGTPNIWRGAFPNASADAVGLIPVSADAAAGTRLHHMCGNIWEWATDLFSRLHLSRAVKNPVDR